MHAPIKHSDVQGVGEVLHLGLVLVRLQVPVLVPVEAFCQGQAIVHPGDQRQPDHGLSPRCWLWQWTDHQPWLAADPFSLSVIKHCYFDWWICTMNSMNKTTHDCKVQVLLSVRERCIRNPGVDLSLLIKYWIDASSLPVMGQLKGTGANSDLSGMAGRHASLVWAFPADAWLMMEASL